MLARLMVVFAVLCAAPSMVVGQGFTCGTGCRFCGAESNPWRFEGTDPISFGNNHIDCCWLCFDCNECNPALVDDERLSATEIASTLASLSPSELRAEVEDLGDRLLLHRERRLLVIQGTSCLQGALAEMIFLSPAQAMALEDSVIPSLVGFFAEERSGQHGEAPG